MIKINIELKKVNIIENNMLFNFRGIFKIE